MTPYTQADADKMFSLLNNAAPYVSVRLSTLGGADKASLMILVSLDARETWRNGILENSRYKRLAMHHDGKIEQFSGYGCAPFRKCPAKSIEHAASKILAWIDASHAILRQGEA